jgi:hypothetical protein
VPLLPFSERPLPVAIALAPHNTDNGDDTPYAARFCAFRRLCCGVNMSFSSLLLRPTPGSSSGSSVTVSDIPFESTSDMDIMESWWISRGGDTALGWCGWARNVEGS